MIGSRRAEFDFEEPEVHRPLYARVLRLRHLAPSGFLCFVFLEGAVALGILLALAELVSWWGVLVLPATVAVMVKLNDVIAGVLGEAAAPVAAAPVAAAETAVTPLRPAGMYAGGSLVGEGATTRLPAYIDQGPGAPVKRPWVEQAEAQQQWIRQSASRRYE